MRHCDTCQKIIQIGKTDRVHVEFTGKFAKLLVSLYGDSYLDFCSLSCFNNFKIPDEQRKDKKP
jgi:hypothetical protein